MSDAYFTQAFEKPPPLISVVLPSMKLSQPVLIAPPAVKVTPVVLEMSDEPPMRDVLPPAAIPVVLLNMVESNTLAPEFAPPVMLIPVAFRAIRESRIDANTTEITGGGITNACVK